MRKTNTIKPMKAVIVVRCETKWDKTHVTTSRLFRPDDTVTLVFREEDKPAARSTKSATKKKLTTAH